MPDGNRVTIPGRMMAWQLCHCQKCRSTHWDLVHANTPQTKGKKRQTCDICMTAEMDHNRKLAYYRWKESLHPCPKPSLST